MIVRFHSQAKREVARQTAWYLKRSPQAAAGFVEELRAALRLVGSRPQSFPVVHRDQRRASMHRYPHGIVFRAKNGYIDVFAVAHPKRKEGYWHTRVM